MNKGDIDEGVLVGGSTRNVSWSYEFVALPSELLLNAMRERQNR
jgi:hypothetical protein